VIPCSLLQGVSFEEGYAEYDGKSPNVKYEDYFSKLEIEAKRNGRGIWGNEY